MTKHLPLDDCSAIRSELDWRDSFKQIGRDIGKDCTTISKEVKNYRVFRKKGAMGRAYNACTHRQEFDRRILCAGCTKNRFRWFCQKCNNVCPDFEGELCFRLRASSYVCNGCPGRNRCTLRKCFYALVIAHNEYRAVPSEAREGISLSEEDIWHLNGQVSPLLFKGQSFPHIFMNNADSVMVSERTLCRLADYNLFRARNKDLSRKVRYSKRRLKKHYKVDKGCCIGRSYQDFMDRNPGFPITEDAGGRIGILCHCEAVK